MKYREGAIPKTHGQLRDLIGSTLMRAPTRHFPESDGEDFEGAYYSMERGVENLRKSFGDAKADQLLDMFTKAKEHYEASENKLGGALMQDTRWLSPTASHGPTRKSFTAGGRILDCRNFLRRICRTKETKTSSE